MDSIKPHFDDYTLECLKQKLADKIGFSIAGKPDCAKLSALILNQNSEYISETTLYRLFFQQGKHKPYKNTLDILSAFVGFSDSLELVAKMHSEKTSANFHPIAGENHTTHSLLYHCLENAAYKPLSDYFDALESESEEIKEKVCLTLFDALKQSGKRQIFFDSFSTHPYVREYFFEKGHDPKFRIKQYDFAYKKYLRGIKNKDDWSGIQENIFGHAVLFRYYFLGKNYEEATRIGQSLFTQNPDSEVYRNHLHFFPYTRYVAYKLWYLHLNKSPKESIEHYAHFLLDACCSYQNTLNNYDKKILFYNTAEAFLASDLPEAYHWKLKNIFRPEFEKYPELVYSKHLKYSLHYFEPNGLMRRRP